MGDAQGPGSGGRAAGLAPGRAASRRHCSVLLAGDLDTPTGGYRYDRRLVQGLRARGWQVDLLVVDAGFPWPTPAGLAQADAALAALPDGHTVVADGLAFGAMPALAHRHRERLRWLALVHHPLGRETGLSATQRGALLASEADALAAARRIVVTSQATARELQALGWAREAPVDVIEPGVEQPARAPQPRPVRAEGLALLCVATITERKGHRVLVDALAGLQDRAWTLRCAGSLTRDAAAAEALRRTIAAHGLDERVRLLGEVDDAGALARLYAEADAFVLPSHYEGYGMVVTEALAHGLPVITTTGGALADTLPPAAGALVPPGDVPALHAALARLIDDTGWRERAAAAARQVGAALPGWDAAVARFERVLTALQAQPTGPSTTAGAGALPAAAPDGSRSGTQGSVR